MEIKVKGTVCILEFGKYRNGDGVAIELIEKESGEPYATATVNLVGTVLRKDNVAIKDYGENDGVLDALMKGDVVSAPLFYVENGHVSIPICKLLINF